MGLYQKIHAVMCESEAISKDMSVGFGGNSYKAISESAVLNEVKPLLKKHGLVLFPVKVDVVERVDTFNTAKGETNRLMTQVKATYKIVDIETGESELLETVGNGVDTQDKASGKALTYGYKCLLQKTFCLFSGEDSDNDHSDKHTDANTKQKQAPKPQKTQTDNTETKTNTSQAQINRLYAISKGKGRTADQVMAAVKSHYKVEHMTDLTRKQYDEVIAKYESMPDMEVAK